jgi:hypothetical protein
VACNQDARQPLSTAAVRVRRTHPHPLVAPQVSRAQQDDAAAAADRRRQQQQVAAVRAAQLAELHAQREAQRQVIRGVCVVCDGPRHWTPLAVCVRVSFLAPPPPRSPPRINTLLDTHTHTHTRTGQAAGGA